MRHIKLVHEKSSKSEDYTRELPIRQPEHLFHGERREDPYTQIMSDPSEALATGRFFINKTGDTMS